MAYKHESFKLLFWWFSWNPNRHSLHIHNLKLGPCGKIIYISQLCSGFWVSFGVLYLNMVYKSSIIWGQGKEHHCQLMNRRIAFLTNTKYGNHGIMLDLGCSNTTKEQRTVANSSKMHTLQVILGFFFPGMLSSNKFAALYIFWSNSQETNFQHSTKVTGDVQYIKHEEQLSKRQPNICSIWMGPLLHHHLLGSG